MTIATVVFIVFLNLVGRVYCIRAACDAKKGQATTIMSETRDFGAPESEEYPIPLRTFMYFIYVVMINYVYYNLRLQCLYIISYAHIFLFVYIIYVIMTYIYIYISYMDIHI